jgi:hypothetical protein
MFVERPLPDEPDADLDPLAAQQAGGHDEVLDPLLGHEARHAQDLDRAGARGRILTRPKALEVDAHRQDGNPFVGYALKLEVKPRILTDRDRVIESGGDALGAPADDSVLARREGNVLPHGPDHALDCSLLARTDCLERVRKCEVCDVCDVEAPERTL